MNDWYERRAEAAADYASEIAYEMFHEGEFDDDIKKLIIKGRYDDAVFERLKIINESKIELSKDGARRP